MSYTQDKPVEKIYYSIGEVAGILDENASLIRFWSDKFAGFIKPARNKKGNRLFTAKDLENFKLIHHLVKDLGMTLEGAQKRMKDNATGEDKRFEVITRLRNVRAKLTEIYAELKEGGEEDFPLDGQAVEGEMPGLSAANENKIDDMIYG